MTHRRAVRWNVVTRNNTTPQSLAHTYIPKLLSVNTVANASAVAFVCRSREKRAGPSEAMSRPSEANPQ